MLIDIVSSGGFGGITTPAKTLHMDTSATTEEKRQTYCDAFDPDALSNLSVDGGNPNAADLTLYTISVTDDQGEEHVFQIQEDAIPDELLDLMDGM